MIKRMKKWKKYRPFLIFTVLLVLLVSPLLYGRQRDLVGLREALESKDRIVALYQLTENWYFVRYVRQEGYVVIPDDLFILNKSGYSLDIKEELHLKINYIKEQDQDFELRFSTELEGRTVTATYSLDKDLRLLASEYLGRNEENVTTTCQSRRPRKSACSDLSARKLTAF